MIAKFRRRLISSSGALNSLEAEPSPATRTCFRRPVTGRRGLGAKVVKVDTSTAADSTNASLDKLRPRILFDVRRPRQRLCPPSKVKADEQVGLREQGFFRVTPTLSRPAVPHARGGARCVGWLLTVDHGRQNRTLPRTTPAKTEGAKLSISSICGWRCLAMTSQRLLTHIHFRSHIWRMWRPNASS